MSSEVEIANRALQHVKVSKRISSRSQGTKEANAIDEVFDEVRDNLLDLHNWNFATKRVKLARLATTPAFEWDYEYQLPALFLRAVSVSDNSTHRGHVAYQLEGGKLLSDASDIYLVYIAQITDPNQMPPTFRAAFSRYLASQIAPAVGQSTALAQGLYEQFLAEELPRAQSIDSVQDDPQQLPESSWITSRYGGRETYEPGDPTS